MPTPATPRNPEAIARYRTRYEVRIMSPGGSWIAGYTERTTRAALLAILRKYADDVLPWLLDSDPITYKAGRFLALGPVSAIVTGRTEREAYWEATRRAA